MTPDPRIAVVGLGGVFPGAADLEQFWANVRAGIDTSREVPRGRWLLDPKETFDPRVGVADKVYCLRGYFLNDWRCAPAGLDLDPQLLARLDPLYHLVLRAGRDAFRSANT